MLRGPGTIGLSRASHDLAAAPAAGFWARLHRDESGGMLDYAMVFGFFAILLFLPVWPVGDQVLSIPEMLFQVLSDYFSMIAFYVSWPFL
jgi:hypothetical protein